MKIQILLVGALLVGSLSVTVAGADTGNCTIYTQSAFLEVASFYLWNHPSSGTTVYLELWQESNGVPDLQRVSSPCEDGLSIPKDTCITHTVTLQQVRCVTEYPVPG